MATVDKDFKIKKGLIVEGTTGTINNHDILTKKQDDQDYIIDLIGGTATPDNTPDTVVKRDGDGDFAAGTITANLVGNVTGDVTGNADTATTLENARTIALAGDVTGSVSFDGSQNVTITASIDGSFATDAEVATAKSQAISTAEDYTDARETAITTAYQSYADAAEADAISTASADATSKANAAQAAAEATASADATSKANAAQAAAEATASADATSKANAAKSAAEATASADATAKANTAKSEAISTASADATSKADAAQAAAISAAALDATTKANAAQAAAEQHADDAVAALVNGAPAVLDTLNELAEALQDNPDIISDLQGIAAGKQDTLTAGSNIDITESTISVTGLDTDDVAEGSNLYFTNQRALDATSSAYDIVGSASNAQAAAESFATNAANAAQAAAEATASADATYKANAAQSAAESTASADATSKANAAQAAAEATASADATTKANAAEYNAKGYADGLILTEVSDRNDAIENAVNALTTDEIEEANNLYFTDARATNAAGVLLQNASTSNVTISYDSVAQSLTVEAENGIADSTTDDLAEGGNNLYFTDERAIDAVSNADIYPNAVIIDNVAKQVAGLVQVATASEVTAYSWAKADYRTAKFLVKTAYGTHTDVAEVLLTLDTSDNIAITEYAMVGTNGSAMTVSADVSGSDVRLRVSTVNNNSTVTVLGTLLA
jgi:hypothetical protein